MLIRSLRKDRVGMKEKKACAQELKWMEKLETEWKYRDSRESDMCAEVR